MSDTTMTELADLYQPSEAMQAELSAQQAVTRVRVRTNKRKQTKTVVLMVQLHGNNNPSVEAKLFDVALDEPPDDVDSMWRELLRLTKTYLSNPETT